MNNIMKALNYQVRRDNFTYYILLAAIGFIALVIFDIVASSNVEISGGIFFVSYSFTNSVGGIIICLGFSTRISGWDYADKTMNYELLSGHSRKQVYWSRVIVSLGWSLAFCAVFFLVPIIFFTAINGWGNNVDFGDAALRYALSIFPVLRLICEYIFLTFICKNGFISLIIGFLLSEVVSIVAACLEEFKKIKLTFHFGMTNLERLFTVDNYSLGYINGEDVYIYEASLEPSFIIGTIAVSLVAGIIFLLAGYVFFKKSDVN